MPTIIRPRGSLWEFVCDECDASWEGYEGDDCYWCDKRYQQKRDDERKRLLWPEWLDWGERYYACSDIDRIVWAHTRGFTGDYVGKWKRDLFNAIPESITAQEAADALRRVAQWMTHIGKSENS